MSASNCIIASVVPSGGCDEGLALLIAHILLGVERLSFVCELSVVDVTQPLEFLAFPPSCLHLARFGCGGSSSLSSAQLWLLKPPSSLSNGSSTIRCAS